MPRTQTPEPDRVLIRDRFAVESAGSIPTGLRPHLGDDGQLTIVHDWAIVSGRT